MRIALCDDNETILKKNTGIVSKVLEDRGWNAELVAFAVARELEEYARKEMIDMAFLDIEIGEKSGIEVAKLLNKFQPECEIVYLTGYLEYATEVYDTSHSCFLLKKQFEDRAERILEKTFQKKEAQEKKFLIEDGKNTFAISEDEIVFVERCQRHTLIHTDSGKTYRTGERISDLKQRLDTGKFARCHNSYIVAMAHIRQYSRTMLILDDGTQLSISRQYISPVREQFMNWCDRQK